MFQIENKNKKNDEIFRFEFLIKIWKKKKWHEWIKQWEKIKQFNDNQFAKILQVYLNLKFNFLKVCESSHCTESFK